MTEEIIIDVSNCRDKHDDDCMAMPICNEYGDLMDYQSCEAQTLCPYRTERIIDRLKQENEELSKLIRGTKDYAEVCSVCKDEVTIYPNISGRTDYTQNEVECRTLAQIITQKNNMEQENKELKEKIIELSEEKGHLIVENNTLKESNQSLSMLGTDLASANETVRKEFFRADKNKDMWREKAEEYRSALEEIKSILDKECGIVSNAKAVGIINEVLN